MIIKSISPITKFVNFYLFLFDTVEEHRFDDLHDIEGTGTKIPVGPYWVEKYSALLAPSTDPSLKKMLEDYSTQLDSISKLHTDLSTAAKITLLENDVLSLISNYGTGLFERGVNIAKIAHDDRPLYWARLKFHKITKNARLLGLLFISRFGIFFL